MECAAISHEMSKKDCYALEPGHFLIRLRTKKDDLKKAVLHFQDKYIPISRQDTRQTAVMRKFASDRDSDYYEVEIYFEAVCERYFFELTDQEELVMYYGDYEFFENEITDIDFMFDCPQNLREEECFLIPEWAVNGVAYQIFPSSFASDSPCPDEVWYQVPTDRKTHLPGNLRGIISRLTYLKELGIDMIYLTPVFQANTNHKYDTVDYMRIDPAFGTEEDLRELVERAHEMGMHVILDGVFNHTSTDFFAFADIREKGRNSKYWDWYFIEEYPLHCQWGEKPNYKSFGYFGGMPKLNLRNPEVEAYIFQAVSYWMERCHIDGWRMDVGDEIGHRFWKRFREHVKSINPQALIIGEVWHPAFDFLEGDEWDTVMNYHFYQSAVGFAAKRQLTAEEFMNRIGYMEGRSHKNVFPVLWNLIGSHDTPRFLSLCGEDTERLKLAASLQLLSPGIPMIYYGDEVGMTGGKDPDCRRGMLWKEESRNEEIFSWYQKLIRLRKSWASLTEGTMTLLKTDEFLGLIEQHRKLGEERAVILFYNGELPIAFSRYAGQYDYISDKIFDGIIKPCQTLLFK